MLKKDRQIHISCDTTASRMTTHPSTCVLCCPYQALWHIFHSQCMQSMLLGILGNPINSQFSRTNGRTCLRRHGGWTCLSQRSTKWPNMSCHGRQPQKTVEHWDEDITLQRLGPKIVWLRKLRTTKPTIVLASGEQQPNRLHRQSDERYRWWGHNGERGGFFGYALVCH
jgi:hypothetical protein